MAERPFGTCRRRLPPRSSPMEACRGATADFASDVVAVREQARVEPLNGKVTEANVTHDDRQVRRRRPALDNPR